MKMDHIKIVPGLLCLMLSFALLMSCDDDNDAKSSKIELLSFGPSGIKHGEEMRFIGNNLDKVTAIVFAPSVEVPRSSFTSVTPEVIKLIVPPDVETGRVILKTPEGDIESKSIFSLEVPVVISGFTPEAKPGTEITVTGEFINWVESVTFPGNLIVEKEDFVSQSQTELKVIVPWETRTGFLVFNTGGTEPLEITTEDVLTVSLPAPASLTPDAIRHAEELTITGADLDLVTQIKFGGGAVVTSDEFVSQSETEIVVTVPATTTDGNLIFTAPSGLEVEGGMLTIILPNVTAFSPSDTDDHNPGVTLTMTGTDLDLIGELSFPNVPDPVTEFVSQSPTQLQVVIPDGAKGGTVVITTIHGFTVPITVPFGDQLTLATVIYDDEVHAPLGAGGGWGDVVTDIANSEQVRVGTKAIKVTFIGGWGGGAQFGNWDGGAVSTAGASFYAFSIYGGPGTGGNEINVNVAGKQVQVAIEEGVWKDVQIPLADFENPAGISEIWFQDRGWSGDVWIDHIGLK